jgi:predicted nucleic acid-binding protein
MIRVTLDTSVLVSALEFGGRPAQILDLHTDEAFVLCISSSIIAELQRILAERFDWTAEDIETTLEPIVSRAAVVTPSITVGDSAPTSPGEAPRPSARFSPPKA